MWTVCFICMSGTAQMLLPCRISGNYIVADSMEQSKILGLVRELNPGPLAPEARIIPLDQQASLLHNVMPFCGNACLVGYALKMLAKLRIYVHMSFQRLLSIFRKPPSLPRESNSRPCACGARMLPLDQDNTRLRGGNGLLVLIEIPCSPHAAKCATRGIMLLVPQFYGLDSIMEYEIHEPYLSWQACPGGTIG